MAPDLPAIAETVKGYSLVYWLAVFAPAATPKPIQQKLFDAIAEAMKDPATVQAMTQGRMEPPSSASTIRDLREDRDQMVDRGDQGRRIEPE